MNATRVKSIAELERLIEELTDYQRAVSYNLSEIAVIEIGASWLVIWRKDYP